MFDTIFGLPVHALILHATVVILPMASLAVIAAAFIPKFRRWAGPVPLIASVTSLILVPITVKSGQALAATGPGQLPQVQRHAQLANLMIFWVIGLVIAAAALYWLHRTTKRGTKSPNRAVLIAIMVVALVTGAGTLVHVGRVGDAGARAVWGDNSG
jgi:formate hydrogenlyase subunit 3/multisubunit Na+/H+ antiporter MnhD subunit